MDLVYQPILNLRTGSVSQIEVLLRPDRSAESVVDFVSQADVGGRMKKLTQEVLETACAAAGRLGRPDLDLSFNLALSNLDEPDLPKRVEKILKRQRREPVSLWFELGDRAQEIVDEKRMACMRALSKLGIRFTVDSFGSDLSQVTLNDLARLPWRMLKIDGGIINAAETDLAQRHAIKSAVTIAEQLRIGVTAKSVENQYVAALVTRLGCTHGQGYYFARPTPIELLGDLLESLGSVNWKLEA